MSLETAIPLTRLFGTTVKQQLLKILGKEGAKKLAEKEIPETLLKSAEKAGISFSANFLAPSFLESSKVAASQSSQRARKRNSCLSDIQSRQNRQYRRGYLRRSLRLNPRILKSFISFTIILKRTPSYTTNNSSGMPPTEHRLRLEQ